MPLVVWVAVWAAAILVGASLSVLKRRILGRIGWTVLSVVGLPGVFYVLALFQVGVSVGLRTLRGALAEY